MGVQIFYVNKVEIVNAVNSWNLVTGVNNVTSLATILSKYAGVNIRFSANGNNTPCGSAISDDGSQINRITMPVNIWSAIVNDLATAIQGNIDGGQGIVSKTDAAWLIGLFINVGYVKTDLWSAAAFPMVEQYNFWNTRYAGASIGYRFAPLVALGAGITINNLIGLNKVNNLKQGTSSAGANHIVASNFGSIIVGKEAIFAIYGIVGAGTADAGNYVEIANSTAVAIGAGGIWQGIVNIADNTLSAGQAYYGNFSSVNIFNKTEFNSKVFQANIGVGQSYVGAKADCMDMPLLQVWG